MNTNFRAIIEMPTLKAVLGVKSLNMLNQKQKKAYKNIKYCADDQWQYVNGWYDEKDEDCRQLMMNPRKLFDLIYHESQHSVYDEGYSGGGAAAESWLKDIRFCGKKFLQTVTLYYTAKLLEEALPEVDGTEEDAARVANELLAMKKDAEFTVDASDKVTSVTMYYIVSGHRRTHAFASTHNVDTVSVLPLT